MEIDDFAIAYRQMVMGYAGGIEELATKMRMSKTVLYNQANLNMPSHVPSIKTLRAAMMITKNYSCLDVMERENGRAAFKLPDFSKGGDSALLEVWGRMAKEYGDIGGKLSAALESGDISHAEAAELEKEALEMISVISEFVARVKGIAK